MSEKPAASIQTDDLSPLPPLSEDEGYLAWKEIYGEAFDLLMPPEFWEGLDRGVERQIREERLAREKGQGA